MGHQRPDVGNAFPVLFPAQADVWVPLVANAPRTRDLVPQRVMGSIQHGAYYVKLSREEYDAALAALKSSPGIVIRT